MAALTVPERIDAGNAPTVLASLSQALADARTQGHAPALDLAALSSFDSSALSLLLQLERALQTAGGGGSGATAPGLILLNPPAKLRELAELYGVSDLLFGETAGAPAAPAPRV